MSQLFRVLIIMGAVSGAVAVISAGFLHSGFFDHPSPPLAASITPPAAPAAVPAPVIQPQPLPTPSTPPSVSSVYAPPAKEVVPQSTPAPTPPPSTGSTISPQADSASSPQAGSGQASPAPAPVEPPPPANTTNVRFGVDASGRFLMQGKPRFLLGVYDTGHGYSFDPASYEKDIFAADGKRKLAGIPLNMYLNYHYGAAPVKAMHALMDTLSKHGMMYLQTVNCFEKGSYRRISFNLHEDQNVRAFAEHPAAAGYYIMDECDDGLVAETAEHALHLRQLDPGGMSLAVLYAASYRDYGRWIGAADVLAVDPYPLYGPEPAAGYAHFKVADHVARLRGVVPVSRPIAAVLQLFKFTSDSRLPTYAEMKAHAVMAIVEGAQGIFWWEVGVNGLQKSPLADVASGMANLRRLAGELALLEPALVAVPAKDALVGNSTASNDPIAFRIAALRHNDAVNPLWSDKEAYRAEVSALERGDTSRSYLLDQGAEVRTLAKVVDGKGYLFAYNYSNKPVTATFTWHRAPAGEIGVFGEGRTIAPEGNAFSDSFGPYEAHVFVVPE